MSPKEITEVKRWESKHYTISRIHRAACDRAVADMKKLYPNKRVNDSTLLEWMIEKTLGKTDPELREYMKLRDQLAKMSKTK